MSLDESQKKNLELFRDCLSGPLVQRSSIENAKSKKRKSRGRKNSIEVVKEDVPVNYEDPDDAEELAEFIDVGKV